MIILVLLPLTDSTPVKRTQHEKILQYTVLYYVINNNISLINKSHIYVQHIKVAQS